MQKDENAERCLTTFRVYGRIKLTYTYGNKFQNACACNNNIGCAYNMMSEKIIVKIANNENRVNNFAASLFALDRVGILGKRT